MNQKRSRFSEWSDVDTDRGRLDSAQQYLRLVLQKVVPDSVVDQVLEFL